MAIVKKMTKRGFTLIELMIVVVIIGVLAALAIYGVQKYVTNAKSAEARMGVGRIGKDALAAFEAEQMAGAVLPLGSVAQTTRSLCGNATIVPAALQAEGVKYQPTIAEFQTGDDSDGWTCLSFSMNQAMNFQYDYNVNVTSATQATDGDTMLAFAQAAMGGQVLIIGQLGTVQSGQLTLAPALSETSVAVGDALDDASDTMP